MAPAQTILFTPMPRGVSLGSENLPASIVVSPRLQGEGHLGAFADWLSWTRRLQQDGLTVVMRSNAGLFEASVDRQPLRPDLWEAIFKADTFVRSHTFDDYSEHGLISYPVRETLSALKSIYQEAGLRLALPAPAPGTQRDDRRGNRAVLRELIDGFDVHWNSDSASRWRRQVRDLYRSGRLGGTGNSGDRDDEGLTFEAPTRDGHRAVALQFAVFHHMPTPPREDLKPDWGRQLDFHQVLSSLGAYPALQRALGLVFDLHLPADFVPMTPMGQFGTITVEKVVPGWEWSIQPFVPQLRTAYVHVQGVDRRLFATAPRALSGPVKQPPVIGLLDLHPARFGLAQVDVDGAMHKTIMLAETWHNPGADRNLDPSAKPEPAPHPQVFDPEATLPSLRSGGLSLFADRRALHLLESMQRSKAFNDILRGGAQAAPFFAEDLVRGYRLDVWDSNTNDWHSLHLRSGEYLVDGVRLETDEEEGFVQLAVMQPAPGATPTDNDLYLHESIARWAGWSLSVEMPGKHLSRYADPAKAVPPDRDDPDYRTNEPVTPFKLTTRFSVMEGSLPRLRFGTRYRIRVRAVDVAGNSLKLAGRFVDGVSALMALPRDPEGFAYLRYEPVAAPLLIVRDSKSLTDPGSNLDRIVIRTYNTDPTKDADAADLTAAQRHIVPPRASVEMCERLGIFDEPGGALKTDPATWQLISQRDAGEFQQTSIAVAGNVTAAPVEPTERIDPLPHLPDPLSRGAAFRDLPGAPSATIGRATGVGPPAAIAYDLLSDPNPRPGSATLIEFGSGAADWQQFKAFRLRLSEPKPGDSVARPQWDAVQRVLSVYLPKGQMTTVPMTSYIAPGDLKLMGQWQWLREHIERVTVTEVRPQYLRPGAEIDQIAHVLQRAVEGGHWMLTPPTLITLVHAVQQPIGRPAFTALDVEHDLPEAREAQPLQSEPIADETNARELAAITSWRRLGATDAYLMGALKVHGASSAKIDLWATWDESIDDVSQPRPTTVHRDEHVDELPLHRLDEHYLVAHGKEQRPVGYYDPEHDQVAFVRAGDWTKRQAQPAVFANAAPRHLLSDTRHRRVRYRAVATTRYREYFPPDDTLEFTRVSDEVMVDVPASARPVAPSIAYVIPTFGWERQFDTNLKRSVRFGGGLRVYLHRPWFSSGDGELLGVALWSFDASGPLTIADRDKFKPFITQWGMDPIWVSGELPGHPAVGHFPDLASSDQAVTLEEATARGATGNPGLVDVVGFTPQFDEQRGMWFADLTVNTFSETYMPFVRLALVRYQPRALRDAKISRVVLADFAQLTPDRSASVTSDPHHPRTVRVVLSGVAPRGPAPVVRVEPPPNNLSAQTTRISVRVQQRDPEISTDLAWRDVQPAVAKVEAAFDGHVLEQPDLVMWAGSVRFASSPSGKQFRLLIEEHEQISANYAIADGETVRQPGRLIYAEAFELDGGLVAAPEKVPPEKVPPEKVPPEKVPPEKVPPEKVPPEKVPPEKAPPEKAPPEKAPPEKAPP
ncbi:MAG: hypothetical protein M3401_14645 [Actinomycetota bacterium]|nr:hypothetical protein [Actinomycetota bacterium]